MGSIMISVILQLYQTILNPTHNLQLVSLCLLRGLSNTSQSLVAPWRLAVFKNAKMPQGTHWLLLQQPTMATLLELQPNTVSEAGKSGEAIGEIGQLPCQSTASVHGEPLHSNLNLIILMKILPPHISAQIGLAERNSDTHSLPRSYQVEQKLQNLKRCFHVSSMLQSPSESLPWGASVWDEVPEGWARFHLLTPGASSALLFAGWKQRSGC